MTSTELAIRGDGRDTDSWVSMLPAVGQLADAVYQTDFVPGPLRGRPPAVIAAVLAGREIGLPPMQSLQHIHIIDGRPTLSAQMQRSLALAAGYQIRVVETNTTRCVVEGRRASADEWTRVTWTLDDAKKAGLLGRQNWQRHPRRMLQARATAELCQLIFSDAIAGMPCTEEAQDGTEGPAPELGVQPAPSNGHVPEKPPARTARRRTPASGSQPAREPAPAASAPQEAAGPPLPGEEEPRPTGGPQPGTGSTPSESATAEPRATGGQVGIIQSHFKRLGFEDHDRDERLAITAQIAALPEGHDLASTKDLTQGQASAVADTLSRCKNRPALMALLTGARAQDTAAEPDAEAGDGN